MTETNITILETKTVHKAFNKLVGSKNREKFHRFLQDSPEAGALIQGAYGLRKIRWGRPGIGKRGGVRIIYYYYVQGAKLYVLDIYAKSEKEDLSSAQRKLLKEKIDAIIQAG